MIKFIMFSFGWTLISVFGGANPALSQTNDQGQGSAARAYRSCVSLAESSPARAVSVAENWRDSGGGAPASHCLALALAASGDYTEAAYELSRAAESLRSSGQNTPAGAGDVRMAIADLLAQSGNAWLLADEELRAYDVFSQALSEISPSSLTAGEIYVDRARASYELADFEGALKDLERALDIFPDRAEVIVYLASAMRAMERFDDAEITIANALALAPGDEAALLERGNVRLSLGNVDGARDDWMQILALYPNGATAEVARKNIQTLDGMIPDHNG